ncbi:hypothetical protein GTA08_BOTSDO04344 [Botryosphaeria dothidea]|uniref:Uncharacterized protein n=1 Tax=Botryosphaeria dothidea TaxID=55169 RepID=A0A8H4IWG6_9PEZI|nr:hypothetical protein GTA08_BOTSDO04344 [Botryosphaeria dothidea]
MENEQTMDAIQQKEEIQPVEDASAGEVPEYRADVRVKIKSGTYPRGYPDGRSVTVKSKQKGVTKRITATVAKGRPSPNGWEYQLRTVKNELYSGGVWVKEDDIM